jgi:hypothetical protein
VLGFVTWLIDKVAGPLLRLRKRPALDVERAEHAGWTMVTPEDVSVNIALTIRNTGRADADSYRAEARVSRDTGIRLTLRDPRNPGDATASQENGDDVIEWQSSELWPPQHVRKIVCTLHLRQGIRVPVAVTLTAPHMKPVHGECEVTWPAREPQIRVLN